MTFIYHHSRNIPCLVTNLKLIPIGFPESVRRITELTVLLVYTVWQHGLLMEFSSGGTKLERFFG